MARSLQLLCAVALALRPAAAVPAPLGAGADPACEKTVEDLKAALDADTAALSQADQTYKDTVEQLNKQTEAAQSAEQAASSAYAQQVLVRDAAGEIVELRCQYDPATKGGDAPDGRKVKATLHWVSAAHAMDAEVRLYSPLFAEENPGAADDFLSVLNPDSLEVLTGCKLEPSLSDVPAGDVVQFERLGYFCTDPDGSADKPVFNRTVGLRDSFAKAMAKN